MKKLWGILIFVFFICSVNAFILIDDDFENKYSLGDRVVLNYSVIVDDVSSGFLETYLSCDGKRSLIDKRYIFLQEGTENYIVEFLLNNEGECVFEIEFLDEEVESEEFEISSDVEIEYSLNGKNFYPGDEVVLEGYCEKFNSEDCEGIIKFSFGDNYEKDYVLDSDNFSISYNVREFFESGSYLIRVENIERDSKGDILSYGKREDSVFVKSVPTFISIDGSEEVFPGEDYNYSINLLDQSKRVVENETVIVKLTDSNNEIFYKDEFISGGNISFYFPSNFPRGTSYLSVFYGSFSESVQIYVEDNKEVSSKVVGGSIVFENVGNVFFEGVKKYEVISRNETIEEFVNLSLDIGEDYSIPLDYSGIYNISSGDDFFSGVSLTGAAVSIRDEFDYRRLIGAFLFLIVLILGYYLVKKKVRGNKNNEENVSKEEPVNNSKNPKMIVKERSHNQGSLKNNVFMIFLKVGTNISDYERIVENYDFSLNKVDSKVGYVVFYEKGDVLSEHKVFKLAKSVYKFSESRGDSLSIVLNKGYFEKKMSLFKKFAIINKKIMDNFPGKFVVGDKFMKNIFVGSKKEERVIEIDGRTMRIWIVDL